MGLFGISRTLSAEMAWFMDFSNEVGIEIYTARGGGSTNALIWSQQPGANGTPGFLRLEVDNTRMSDGPPRVVLTVPRIPTQEVVAWLRIPDGARPPRIRTGIFLTDRTSQTSPWMTLPADGRWHEVRFPINSMETGGDISPKNALLITFFFENLGPPDGRSHVDIDRVSLMTENK